MWRPRLPPAHCTTGDRGLADTLWKRVCAVWACVEPDLSLKHFLNSSLFYIKVKPQQTPEPTLEQKLLEWIYFGHSHKLYRAQGCVCVCESFVISADSSTAPFHRFNETNLPKMPNQGSQRHRNAECAARRGRRLPLTHQISHLTLLWSLRKYGGATVTLSPSLIPYQTRQQ